MERDEGFDRERGRFARCFCAELLTPLGIFISWRSLREFDGPMG